ncbi:MAG: 30S ribosome-binding factor RbfA [Methylotenera sp.]
MAKEFSRSTRVAEQMQRELADLLMFEVKDPRIGMVTITAVEVTGDMAHAKIFYSAPQAKSTEAKPNMANHAKTLQSIQNGLENSAGYLRTQVAKRMLLRTVPQLHFVYDESIDIGMKMAQLIDAARASDKSNS